MAKKTTTATMRTLKPKHVKAAKPKETVEQRRQRIITKAVATGAELDKAADVIASVAVEVAAVEVPQPLAVGQMVAYDHPNCLGAGKSGVILAVDGPKAKVQFGGGARHVLLKKLVVFPASA
jgi:hypothetical protein